MIPLKEGLPEHNVPREALHRGVSIVIPCLNEITTIKTCVGRANEALAEIRSLYDIDGEVVVADNGSTDGSQAAAEACGARVISVARRGYGAALIEGMNAAKGRFLVMGDADCSYDFFESVPMIGSLLEGNDLCMGSRFRGEIKPGAMPWKNKHIGNPVLSGILRFLFQTPVSDAHCGLRALTRDCFDRLKLSSTGMEFASEMVLKAALTGCRISEVPVTLWPDRRDRAPHLRPWRDGWRHLTFMLMLSPVYLFLFPSLLVGWLGSALFVALISRPEGSIFWFGGLPFGDHWMILAAGMMTVSHQLCLFGLLASIYGVKEGYFPLTPRLIRFLAIARLENLLLAGFGLIALGVFLFGQVVFSWVSNDFGPLAATRDVVGATTLFVLGLQTCFGGFLVSIVSGNRVGVREEADAFGKSVTGMASVSRAQVLSK